MKCEIWGNTKELWRFIPIVDSCHESWFWRFSKGEQLQGLSEVDLLNYI